MTSFRSRPDQAPERYYMGNQPQRSRGRTITETDLVLYSMLTRDWADIHTDHHLVAKTVFKRPIAHAGLTLAIATGLMAPDYVEQHPYDMSAIRFVRPAFLGDSVYVELDRENDRPERRFTIVNQHGEVLVESSFRSSASQ